MARNILRTGWIALALATALGCQAPGQPVPTAAPPASPAVSLRALSVSQLGSGGGQIVSEPAGLKCPSAACAAEFPLGTQVKLTAVPDAGWVFEGWSQACNGSDPVCLITMTEAQKLSFSFKPAAQPCDVSQVLCGTGCVDARSDANNCGGCSIVCDAGDSCVDGACVPPAPSCAAPNLLCGTQCIDPGVDGANCGGCGTVCGAGEICAGASCMAVQCDAPNLLCGTQCVDPATDSANCGACGSACPADQSCVSAACVPNP